MPLNDSLTSFRLVAVADAGVQKFGTGSTSIRVTQDLQVLAGLPPLVREGDRFARDADPAQHDDARDEGARRRCRARPTCRARAAARSRACRSRCRRRTSSSAPAQAKEVVWPVDVPADAFSITWEAAADEQRARRTA